MADWWLHSDSALVATVQVEGEFPLCFPNYLPPPLKPAAALYGGRNYRRPAGFSVLRS